MYPLLMINLLHYSDQTETVKQSVNSALEDLFANDAALLASNCSERSITHKLAVYLGCYFSEYDVDCEYNREGIAPKRLLLLPKRVCTDSLDAVTVFPDIVVHKRGTNDKNLLVIEVKKASSRISAEHDYQKLDAFKDQLRYAFAAHIIVGISKDDSIMRRVGYR